MDFSNKILLITGGTGSFGNAVIRKFLNKNLKEIRVFSRDEKKQEDMRQQYNNPLIKFYIGDVRDRESLDSAMTQVDFVFHAAALKQVPSCEFYPLQALQTNATGTSNVVLSATAAGVKKVICLSTDKAVYPVNAMGMSKALMEKIFIAQSRHSQHNGTTICGTRYGNVMASRGSVIPLFIDQIKANKPITITDPEMTRFMMSLDEAVNLVLYAFKNGESGDIFVQKSLSTDVHTLADSVRCLMNAPKHPILTIGTRHGEKLYETLLTREEMVRASDQGDYFKIPADNRELNYNTYLEQGKMDISKATEFNSHNTTKMTKEVLMNTIRSLPETKSYFE